MALRGTLKDFGIADAFSLIGTQNKTGKLQAIKGDETVTLYFLDGSVVRSDASRRQKTELLGGMLLRSEAITDLQLQEALSRHKATARRLGDVLIDMGAIASADLQTFTRLQSTETVYRIFLWHSGTYEFSQLDAPPDAWHPPVRAELLLMEGFRQSDDWPVIRRQLHSYAITFTTLVNLDSLLAAASVDADSDGDGAQDEFSFDMDFGEAKAPAAKTGDPRLRHIERRERLVYSLVAPGRDVQKIIDLSRIGEFEACQALTNLMDAGIVAAHEMAQVRPSAEATVGGISATQDLMFSGNVGSQAMGAGAALLVWAFLLTSGLNLFAADSARGAAEFIEAPLEQELGLAARNCIREALAVYHASHGKYPETLGVLVEEGFLAREQLHFPWQQPYTYSRDDAGYTLLRPVY